MSQSIDPASRAVRFFIDRLVRFDVIEFAGTLKAEVDLRKIPMLGFFSHVEVEVQREATAVGFDRVIPRSLFARDLASILKGD